MTRADIEAATPKCPKVDRRKPCDKPLHWEHTLLMWSCPAHGAVLTAQALMTQQRAA